MNTSTEPLAKTFCEQGRDSPGRVAWEDQSYDSHQATTVLSPCVLGKKPLAKTFCCRKCPLNEKKGTEPDKERKMDKKHWAVLSGSPDKCKVSNRTLATLTAHSLSSPSFSKGEGKDRTHQCPAFLPIIPFVH